MRMGKKPSKPRMGRPPLPPGKRRGASMGFRPTPEIREKLEEAANANGRSMSQEVEHRLEQSFEGDEALGGRQFRAMFSLFGNAAVLIEQQTGKAHFEDWYTYVAVRNAWQHLIAGFGPSPPAEYHAAFMEAAAAPVPKFPMPPTPPAPPGSSLGTYHQYEQQCKDYDAAVAVYEKESAVYEKAGEALRRSNETTQAQIALGKDVAASLLPERPKKKA